MSSLKDLTIKNTGDKELPKSVVQMLTENGYFKLFIPKSLGGLEFSLVEACDYLIETARINPSLGWVHNLGAGANFFCGFFENSVAKAIFSNPNVITSGSGRPTGTFRENAENFILNGSWDKCSGVNFATHLTCVAKNEENPEEIKNFILPSEGIVLKDDWNTFGLRASSSYSFTLVDFKLAKNHEFEINKIKSFKYYPIYHIPFDYFARICLSSTFEGITQRFIEDIEAEIRNKNHVLKGAVKNVNAILLEMHESRSKIAKSLFANSINSKNEDYTSSFLSLSEFHKAVFKEVNEIFFNAGVRVTEEESPTNWSYRDLCTAIQHYMLK
jgi:hypothetical protein